MKYVSCELLGSDGAIAAFLRDNGPSATWIVAMGIKMQTVETSALMRKLEADGIVRISPGFKYTAHDNLVWELV